jgi:hypothetical protein
MIHLQSESFVELIPVRFSDPLTIGMERPSMASLVWISFPSNTFINSRDSLGAYFEINHP